MLTSDLHPAGYQRFEEYVVSCVLRYKSTDVSEELITSILRAEHKAEQETSKELYAICALNISLLCFLLIYPSALKMEADLTTGLYSLRKVRAVGTPDSKLDPCCSL
jgi:hypothetical protein